MQSIERMVESSQAVMDSPGNEAQGDEISENPIATRDRSPISSLLRRLRGTRTLRQIEAETGISNAYLSNIESGAKRLGVKILSKLAQYYRVSLQVLLETAGLPFDENAVALAVPTSELQRIYEFVVADPKIITWRPAEPPPDDVKKFVIRIYEHYTGKKLL